MKGKLVIISFLVYALTFSIMAFDTYAFDYAKTKGCHRSFEDKFFQKAKLMLSNQEELSLSGEQVNKIEGLKLKTKKDLIKTDAEIDIIALDLKTEMQKDSIDTDTINKLIDKKYDLKKEKTKSLVVAFATLKDVLTKEQKDKMKSIWKKCKMQFSTMGGKMKHHMMGEER